MKLASPVRAGLLAGALATLLNLLFLIAEALLLYGTGLLTPRQKLLGDNAETFVVLGTILLCIPELIAGIVFGAVFVLVGKGGRWTGSIAGAILWSIVPLGYGLADVAHYMQVKSPVQPPPPDWKQEDFEYDIVYPVAWLTKELLTGLVIGYFMGRDVARRRAAGSSSM